MFNDKPIINIGPVGFSTDIRGNNVGQFDSRGNFTQFGSSFPTGRVDPFGNVRDNITGNVIGRTSGILPMRNDLIYTHRNDHLFNMRNDLILTRERDHLNLDF